MSDRKPLWRRAAEHIAGEAAQALLSELAGRAARRIADKILPEPDDEKDKKEEGK